MLPTLNRLARRSIYNVSIFDKLNLQPQARAKVPGSARIKNSAALADANLDRRQKGRKVSEGNSSSLERIERRLLVPNTSALQALRSLGVLAARFALALARRRRYVPLTPSALTRQIVFDRRHKRKVAFQIRNQIDFSTGAQVYLCDDYGVDKLKRGGELEAFYLSIVEAGKTPLIVDCGGNIGLATRYFAENYPGSKIVCIEPEPSNVAQAKINNDSENVVFLEAAVGSESRRGRIVDPGLGHNAFRIVADGEGATEIVTINDMLERYPETQYVPFLVKIDIEGFESDLFSMHTEWIEKFPLLIIELHDWMLPRSNSASSFLRAIAPLNRDFVLCGENVFSISNRLL